ncbi:MAG: hypothetical protein ACRC0G_04410 [Fusobacteriaceae bacterium]
MNFVLSEKELWSLGVKEEEIIKLSLNNDKICCGAVTKNDIIWESLDLYFTYKVKGENVLDYVLAKELFEQLSKQETFQVSGDSLIEMARQEIEYRVTNNSTEGKRIADKIFKFRSFLERMGEEGER